MIPSGPIARLIVFIKATVPSPSSSAKNSFLIPTPCLPVPEKTNVAIAPPGIVSRRARLTGPIERERALDHALNEPLYGLEFFVCFEGYANVEVS